MKNCEFKNRIDDYLLDRLDEKKKAEFEKHYFNCEACFKSVSERDEMITVIRSRGAEIFRDVQGQKDNTARPRRLGIFGFSTPLQWVTASAAVIILLIIALYIFPPFNKPHPQFFINEDSVRGDSVTLISPVINTDHVPQEFSWRNNGEGIEYRIYLYSRELLWSASTNETSISVPREIQDRMTPGTIYSWQVKAFSREGSLIAVSSKIQFQIFPN